MTLIAYFMSDDHCALVSDRRLTWIEGQVERREDTQNKALVLVGSLLMGFTGLARLDGERTDLWAGGVLAGVSQPNDFFDVLAHETQAAITRSRVPRHLSGHAYVAVGYMPKEKEGLAIPVCIQVSNALTGRWGGWQPSAEWKVRGSILDEPFKIGFAGITPSEARAREYVAWIHDYRQRYPGRIRGVLELMARAVREVAAAQPGVGSALSVSVLPRSAYPAQSVSVTSFEEPLEALSTFYLPDSVDELDRGVVYPPLFVEPGLAIGGGVIRFNAHPDDPLGFS